MSEWLWVLPCIMVMGMIWSAFVYFLRNPKPEIEEQFCHACGKTHLLLLPMDSYCYTQASIRQGIRSRGPLK